MRPTSASLRPGSRPLRSLPRRGGFVAAAFLISAPAIAADRLHLALPAGRLDNALIALGGQAGVSLGLGEAQASARQVPALSGTMSVEAALDRLLAGTGLRALRVGASDFRIERAPIPASRKVSRPAAPPPPTATPSDTDTDDITVTASKQGLSLFRLAGSASVLELDRDTLLRGSRGSAQVVDNLPIVTATSLGPGRNKLFIRGIADSSFTGPTQSTVGQYLGDVRVSYNAPDPDLVLYDVARVEVLEGPQGTLYGAGSLGGVLRIVPNAPVFRLGASADLGATATEGGALGYDVSAMVNLPVGASVALRGVGYRSVDGGYIDDPGRRRHDINRTTTSGGRLALRAEPGDDWTIDASGLVQSIKTPDSQYAVVSVGDRDRRSTLSQPFDNDFRLGQLSVGKTWAGGLRLVSATGLVSHSVDATYDATGLRRIMTPLAYSERGRILLLSHETRLSHAVGSDGAGWVAGIGLIYDRDRTNRTIGTPANPVDITGVVNRTFEVAAFGEATLALSSRLNLTAGGRIGYSRTEGRPITPRGQPQFDPQVSETRVLPTAGASWLLGPRLSAFVRYQNGFRGGGLAVARGVGLVARFEPDALHMVEGGLRLGRAGKLTGAITGSYSSWNNIQADLVASSGLPFTSNLGDGRIYGLEATADWAPVAGLSVSGAVLFDDSKLTKPTPQFIRNDASRLPNSADVGARLSVAYRRPLGGGDLVASAWERYFGRSRLDVGTMFHFAQGGYSVLGGNLAYETSHWRLGLTLDNAADSKANRFALGNPFSAARGDQVTPPRPRNVRLSAGRRF